MARPFSCCVLSRRIITPRINPLDCMSKEKADRYLIYKKKKKLRPNSTRENCEQAEERNLRIEANYILVIYQKKRTYYIAIVTTFAVEPFKVKNLEINYHNKKTASGI